MFFALDSRVRLWSFVFLRSSLLPLLVLSLEQFVLVVQAIQFTVEQMNLLRRLETDALQCFLVAGYHPRCGTGELELQRLAHIAVQAEHIFVLCQPLTVRRVDDYQGTVRIKSFFLQFFTFQLFDAYLLDVHVTLHACRADVLHCGLYGIETGIRTVDVVRELTLVTVVLADGSKQIFVEVLPVLKCKMLAEDAGWYVQRD